MSTTVLRRMAPLGAWLTIFLSNAAQAQQPAPLTPEELAEIQRATGADASAAQKDQPPPPAPGGAEAAVKGAVQSLNPNLAFIADFALAAFSQKKNFEQGGHDPTQNGFNLQALELSASADVDPYFKFAANIVFGPEEVELEEAYATTTALPGSLEVRAGQFLTRFGRANATHPHTWEFVDQPFVLTKMMGPDGNRGLGLEASWLTPLPWYVELVASETMANGACCAKSFFGDEDRQVKGPQDLETTFAIKQFHTLSDDWSLATGLSAAFGPNASAPDAESVILGADVYLKYRPISRESPTVVSLQAEALTRRRATPAGTLADSGLYAQILWRFAQRWSTAARYEFATGLANDDLDPEWTRARHRVSAALTLIPTEFSRLRLQGSVDRPLWLRDPILASFLALEVAIGAHGAHAF